ERRVDLAGVERDHEARFQEGGGLDSESPAARVADEDERDIRPAECPECTPDSPDDVVAGVRIGRGALVAGIDDVVTLAREVSLPRLELLAGVLAEAVQQHDYRLRLAV